MRSKFRTITATTAIPAIFLGIGAVVSGPSQHFGVPALAASEDATGLKIAQNIGGVTAPENPAELLEEKKEEEQPQATEQQQTSEQPQASEQPKREKKRRDREERPADTAQQPSVPETTRETVQEQTAPEPPAPQKTIGGVKPENASPKPVQETVREIAPETEPRRKKDRDRPRDVDTARDKAPADNTRPRREKDRKETVDAPRDNRKNAETAPEVRRLLRDDRAPSALSERELRDRLQATRSLLRDENLSRRDSRRLRGSLANDREELRARVAKREGTDTPVRDRDRNRRDRRVVNDDTPASQLDRRELRRRIDALRAELQTEGLPERRRERLRDRLQSDRRELREWRRERRQERRERLRRARRNNEVRITIGGNFALGIGGNVPVAEIGDEEIMRQLTAGPRRRIERRYSVREYARRPELRDAMPGIEVDTINFAFNEYRIGPEEVDELERLGEAIEQIVAAHPYEVFVVEGHTDAVGSDAYNQNLSEKRAAAVREALLEYFVIEPENLITVGYGERYLRIPTEEPEAENRRVTLRRATPFLDDRRS